MIDLSGFSLQIFQGTAITIQLAISALVVGLFFGLLGAIGETTTIRWVRYFATLLISIVRGLPELLIIFFVYFGGTLILTRIFNYSTTISPFIAGTIALALIFGAYASQTLRAALQAIPKHYEEAAIALGMSRWQINWRIIFPQLWRNALPGLGNLWFVLLKDTALISLIGLSDLVGKTQIAASTTQQPFTFFLLAACVYLILTSLSLFGLHLMERYKNA